MADGRKPTGKHPDKRLSPAFVRKASKPGRYYDCRGNGLFLKSGCRFRTIPRRLYKPLK